MNIGFLKNFVLKTPKTTRAFGVNKLKSKTLNLALLKLVFLFKCKK